MNYTKTEISKLALGQLKVDKLQRAVDAFNGFKALFGRPWLDEHFQGVQSADLVLYVLSLWENWLLVNRLDKSEELMKRWKSGMEESGVSTEIGVIAYIVSTGAKVELFPKVGRRVPDLRFQADSLWIYGEASSRGLSKVRKRCTSAVHQIASAASRAIDGKHGKVAILRDLVDDELERTISWLYSLSECNEASLEDFAVFRTGAMGSTIDQDQSLVSLVPQPRFFATSLSANHGNITHKGSAGICISDQSAQDVLEAEASQLSRDDPGVVFLNISKVLGGITEWSPLIQRRLQPSINTRISGVMLFQSVLYRDGPVLEGHLIINRYAKNPLSKKVIVLLRGMFTKPSDQITQSEIGLPILKVRFMSDKKGGDSKEGIITLFNGRPKKS